MDLYSALKSIDKNELVIGSFQRYPSWFGEKIAKAFDSVSRLRTFGTIQLMKPNKNFNEFSYGYFQSSFGDGKENYSRNVVSTEEKNPIQITDGQQRLQIFYNFLFGNGKYYVKNDSDKVCKIYFNLDNNDFELVNLKSNFKFITCSPENENEIFVQKSKDDDLYICINALKDNIVKLCEVDGGHTYDVREYFKNTNYEFNYERGLSINNCINRMQKYFMDNIGGYLAFQMERPSNYESAAHSFLLKNDGDGAYTDIDKFFCNASIVDLKNRDIRNEWFEKYNKEIYKYWKDKDALILSATLLFGEYITISALSKLYEKDKDKIRQFNNNYSKTLDVAKKVIKYFKNNDSSLNTIIEKKLSSKFTTPIVYWMYKQCLNYLTQVFILKHEDFEGDVKLNGNIFKDIFEILDKNSNEFPKDKVLTTLFSKTISINIDIFKNISPGTDPARILLAIFKDYSRNKEITYNDMVSSNTYINVIEHYFKKCNIQFIK